MHWHYPQRAFAIVPLFVAGLTGGATAMYADEFSLKLSHFAPIEGQFCDDVAASEAVRLVKFIGPSISVIGSRCLPQEFGDFRNLWNIEITYNSPAKLAVVSTVDTIGSDRPGFGSSAECKKNIATEAALFANMTGLQVFDAYCQMPVYKHSLWELAVIGFGLPVVRPYTTAPLLFGTALDHTRASFVEMVQSHMKRQGFAVSEVSFINHMSHAAMAIRYYGSSQLALRGSIIAKFEDSDDCIDDISRTNMALDAAGVVNYGTYCQEASNGLFGPELVTLTNNGEGLRLTDPGVAYANKASCQAQLPTVVNHYKQDL